ncbi:glutathione S-transferase N-terminal domain-containing protein [Bradyrhizobium sp. SHOUNA76]|uniref:glutathione S-transferase N-terminal domain-containing protein n=1 Tax=Bradyrhizobium sp. SHOUNA76 TaxID=2908927 RepID=UPI001FF3A513|nr:glutathione S-transferase N-terminal domain-containing protein [Bradyrhizobium sp. SHOUNA76]MCJ9700009.1 glutathione S-transferase N-terminal domain-containing protein [Bradyrhizobium sp. SHOUNA76]
MSVNIHPIGTTASATYLQTRVLMTELILHHYDFSNYSEKVRVAMGFKSLPWQSVIVPAVMPKPDLTPLTGGYRRAPVLQVGADVRRVGHDCRQSIPAGKTLRTFRPEPRIRVFPFAPQRSFAQAGQ